MSVSDAHPCGGEESPQQSLVRAQSLLEEALALLDEHAAATPELGARLQELIDAVKSRTS